MTASADPAQLLVLALRAARRAGALLLDVQRERLADRRLTVDTKTSASDPVSEADREAERTIVDLVLAERPDDGVVGEEHHGDRPGTTGLRWVVDPLDGTVNFLHHLPQWSVSIAVEDDEGPLVGVVHHPDLRETFHALRGGGAWHGERRLHVHDPAHLDEVLLVTGFSYEPTLREAQLRTFRGWAQEVRYVRRLGSAALDLAWVAAARAHAYVEAGLNRWDWSAGSLLVEEAGGVVSHVDVPYGAITRPTVVAAGPRTHERLLDLVLGPGAAG